MPTLYELFSHPVSLVSFALFAGLLVWERVRPARPLPHAPFWFARGIASFLAYFLVSSYLPLWLGSHLAPLRLFDAERLGTLGGGLLALFAYELLAYVYHRSIHRFDLLFRIFHQMHHSAERLDVLGAFWFSPFDMVGFTVMSTVALSLFGLSEGAITRFLLSSLLLAIFQHTNVKTPGWLGYVVQRPESHAHHHARGVHRDNYADLPLIDLLFGTFENPASFPEEQGYYPGASQRVLEMLLCCDVSEPSRPSLLDVRAQRLP